MSSYVLYLSSALFDTRFLTLYFCRQIKSSLMEVFSIIIPVYNRPEEIDDLLNSLTRQTYVHFEVIVVDDGSSIPCEPVVNAYNDRLRIRYFYIENSGPGLARNQGTLCGRRDRDCLGFGLYRSGQLSGTSTRVLDAL